MKAAATAYDVAVIGGGASGLAAAFAAAWTGARVVVLERDVACGLSILATGNGRCNLSNERLDPARYRRPAAARVVMGEEPERSVAAFFDRVGVWTAAEGEGRLYPYSRRAASVRDALLGACLRAGVELRCGCTLTAAHADADAAGWELALRGPERPVRLRGGRDEKAALRAARRALSDVAQCDGRLHARAVVLAPGGRSEGICGIFGLPHVPERPVLCPIACAVRHLPKATAALDGVRVHAALTLRGPDGPAWREAGEALFRPYGISGIAAFNLSRRIRPGDEIVLDLFPEMDEEKLAAAFERRADLRGDLAGAKDADAWFDGVLDRRVGSLVREVAERTSARVTPETLARAAKGIELTVAGTAGEQAAQVRQGGIPFDAVDLETLELAGAGAPGVFACGEALDMDADCGGFNLAWAWLSGLRAGSSAAAAARR